MLRPRHADTQPAAARGSALIINAHPLYRDALAQLLSPMVIGSRVRAAGSVEEGLRIAPELSDLGLVLLDVGLRGIRGTDAILAVAARCPRADIVVISASDDRLDAMAAVRAGARLVISKAVSTQVMAEAIRRALRRDFSGPQWITRCATAGLVAPCKASLLTPRQFEIVGLLHLSNKEIGLRLDITEITVKAHVSSLFRVLGVTNRTQAVQALRRLSENNS
jgi:two-component system, NarL family, nitrate/nitrite response regulator NarL